MGEQHKITIPPELDGVRLDKALSILLSDISRSRIQSLILQEKVLVNNQSGKWGSSKVRQGMKISVNIPDADPLEVLPENIPIDIVFEDEHLIVINKQAGMVVHPATGNTAGTLVNAVLYHCGDSLSGIGGVKRPGIVHRIDKDTSGLIVVAKNDKSHAGLTELFKTHDIERMYTAFVWNTPNPLNGTVNAPIGRNKTDRKKMSVLKNGDPTGKDAITHYKTINRFGDIGCRIECRLETGRTHQIRVHMNSIGNGLIGDPSYGKTTKGTKNNYPELYDYLNTFNRQALHATVLGFVHPITKENMYFESNLPKDMIELEKIIQLQI